MQGAREMLGAGEMQGAGGIRDMQNTCKFRLTQMYYCVKREMCFFSMVYVHVGLLIVSASGQ